jgi:hypothetical protein
LINDKQNFIFEKLRKEEYQEEVEGGRLQMNWK